MTTSQGWPASCIGPRPDSEKVLVVRAARIISGNKRTAGQAPEVQMTPSPAGVDTEQVEPKRRQTDGADLPVLPDSCNFGTVLRVLVFVNVGALLAAAVAATAEGDFLAHLLQIAAIAEPVALGSLLILCPLRRHVNGRPPWLQYAVGMAVPAALTLIVALSLARVIAPAGAAAWLPGWAAARAALAAGIALALIEWLRLRQLSMQPSQAEGRLQALQARIRPHFLFNSLNTVLGLMRSDVRQAEHTLENLADLFRVFMRDSRELVPLDEEVLLCKEYLSIEQLRLADRLQVRWEIDGMPGDALLPSLLLQPLVENAVHHGIEPRSNPGEIAINIAKTGERVRVDIVNPLPERSPTRPGNQMALSNVRERLGLTFDVEGQLITATEEGVFRATVQFPYRKERRRRDGRRNIDPDH